MKSIKISNLLGFFAFWSSIQLCRCLPFRALFGLSTLLYYLSYYLFPLRKKVAMENLGRCFPDKSDTERKSIYKKHLQFMFDLILETFKGFTLSPEALCKRFRITNPKFLEKYSNSSVLVITAHYGNWEWGRCLPYQLSQPLAVIYKPLHNPLVNRYLLAYRKKTQVVLISVRETFKYLNSHIDDPKCYFLIADQHPGGAKEVHWMTFFNQDTACIVGPEKCAKSFNYPVLYAAISRIKRGYYEVEFLPITDHPKDTQPGEIIEASMRLLEQQIRKDPAYWLWGHRRWKLTKAPTST